MALRNHSTQQSKSIITNTSIKDNYIGEKSKEIRNGFGIYSYKNNFFKYDGEWKNGKKHGHGKLSMADGSYYEGEFIDGEIIGYGTKFWAKNGNMYSGQFYLGELHGKGEMKYGNGEYYIGEWCKNQREVFGKWQDSDGQLYEGEFYQHKRHGEGVMIYKNKDSYNGNWIRDHQHGSGKLIKKDGTVYEGQFSNNLFNGYGLIQHCSGLTYEGMWINGKPVASTAKIYINGESGEDVIELLQGHRFNIYVQCLSADGKVAETETGRQLKISAGFRHYLPKEGSSLLDIIEDIEENPIPTPFGYPIVAYPLTDTFKANETFDTDTSNFEDDVEVEESDDNGPVASLSEIDRSPIVSSEDNETLVEETTGGEYFLREESPPPPPIDAVRTENGTCFWESLLLPREPQLYRPFTILDDEFFGKETNDKAAAIASKNRVKRSGKADSKDKKAETTTSTHKDYGGTMSSDTCGDDANVLYNRIGDTRFCRPGEYVIMVEDITEPSFMDERPEPGFIRVRILPLERKERKAAPKVEKEKKKQWDTARLISHAMVHEN